MRHGSTHTCTHTRPPEHVVCHICRFVFTLGGFSGAPELLTFLCGTFCLMIMLLARLLHPCGQPVVEQILAGRAGTWQRLQSDVS